MQQQQQQLATADGILSQINDYISSEASQAGSASLQNLLQLQQAVAAAEIQGPDARRTTKSPQPEATAAEAPETTCERNGAAQTAVKAAALQALGMDSEGYTPELLASLALRFQSYNLPPGLSSMPDLGEIALAVQQEQQEAAQRRQQQQEQWMLDQQQKQLARQTAVNRHLQLYQLGVMQQRKKLQQGGRHCAGLGRRKVMRQQSAALVVKQQVERQPSLQQEQQQQPPQQQRNYGPSRETGLAYADIGGNSECDSVPAVAAVETAPTAAPSKVLASDTAECSAAVSSKESSTPDQGPQCGCTPCQTVEAALAAAMRQQHTSGSSSSSSTCCPAAGAAGAQCAAAGMNAVSCKPFSTSSCFAANSSLSGSTATTDSPPVLGGTTVPGSTLRVQSIQQPLGLANGLSHKPPLTRYKSDLPGAAVGASHGYLSPDKLSFDHLPGSRRQVRAAGRTSRAW